MTDTQPTETDNLGLKVKKTRSHKIIDNPVLRDLDEIGKKNITYSLDDSIFEKYVFIEGPEKKDRPTFYFILPDGIYLITKYICYSEKKIPYNKYTRTLIYEWDNFELKSVLINNETNEIFVDFILNGKSYKEYSISDLKKTIFDFCYCDGNKACINRLMTKLIDNSKCAKKQFSKYCGFGEEGWKLPPEYYVSSCSGIANNIHRSIEKMNCLIYNPDIIRQQFKQLYNLTTIKYKDIIFAFNFSNIFAYSIKKSIGLQPFLGIGSKGGGKGKTILSTLLTTKSFMNLDDKDVLTIDNVESKSRFLDYISSSTFGICIDDCEKLDDSVKSEIKSHLTAVVTTDKKDSKQKLISTETLKSSLILNYNEIPEFLIDLQILSRGILIDVSDSFYDSDKAMEWRKLFNEIPTGSIGKYIIDCTKNWTRDDILQLFYSQENLKPDLPARKITDRQNLIYKYVNMGKQIVKLLFDIDLDLHELPKVIFDTNSIVAENYIEDFIKQLLAQFDENHGLLICKESNWIRHQVYEVSNKNREKYFCYTSENIDDLNRHRFGNDKSKYFSLVKFQQLISTILPCYYTTQRAAWRDDQISVKMIQVMKQNLMVYLEGGIDAIIKEKEKFLSKIQDKIK